MIGFDTNVLIYSVDPTIAAKQTLAMTVLRSAFERKIAMIPLLVLAEFVNVGDRKLRLHRDEVRGLVERWRRFARTDGYGTADLDTALDAHRDHGLSIWDALIWAVCDRVGATILVTEDLQDGRTLGRVTFLDPFNPANARRLGIA